MVVRLVTHKACLHHINITEIVVDYMITSKSLLSQVLYFNVSLNKPRLSDHSKISCKIMPDYSMQCKPDILLPFPVKYKWTETSLQSFKDALCSCSIKQKILNFENLDLYKFLIRCFVR